MTSLLSPPVATRARARLDALLDTWTLVEAADGVVVARGTIGDTHVVAFATDSTVQGGALGQESCRAIAAANDRAVAERVPVVGIWHSGGARLREGVAGLHAVGMVFASQVRASGRVPQLSVVLGPAAGARRTARRSPTSSSSDPRAESSSPAPTSSRR